jgi:hypothetical protein
LSKAVIDSEIVEKPKSGDLVACKYFILLHAKLKKMPKWDFSDSLSRYMQLSPESWD